MIRPRTYLRSRREGARKTLKAYAPACGVSESTLGLIERGISPITIERAPRIAEAYGFTLLGLLCREFRLDSDGMAQLVHEYKEAEGVVFYFDVPDGRAEVA